ncbi:MAG TPA: PAS domain S-box protein [Sphingomonas sp.]|uniref:PAS domain S-box protein n=1 Tax=Sphingomonas sp. TaxID=28214 RepID=UPI002BACA69E|nr:PAS domain S-box protein [Sphingomonas sp.]HMI20397.1 PAS domain S-box protein [Sphingomonas sp.]
MARDGQYPLHAPDGALRTLIATHDWAATPLGPIEHWPAPLRNAVSLLLSAAVPMVLFWGPELIALYNDPYALAIGDRHPAALGGRAPEKWTHIWPEIGPVITRVRESGVPELIRDSLFPLWRKGITRMAQLDIAYSAVRASDGAAGGVLCIIYETTERAQAVDAANAERERLAQMFEQAPSFMCLLREPGHIYEFANHAYLDLVGHRAVIGESLASALPELVAQGFVALLDQVAETGQAYTRRSVPITLSAIPGADDRRFLDLIFQPIVGPDGAVTGIFVEGSDVSDRARVEAQLELSESTLGLAAEMAEIGTWDLDLVSNRIEWSDHTRAMFGISPAAPVTLEDFYEGLHPEDRKATTAAFLAALDPDRRAHYDVEYRTIGKEDGVVRWVAAKGRGVFEGGRCVRAIGTVLDITRRNAAQEELRESEARFRTLADSAPALIWMCDEQGALVFANRWHEETFGRPVTELMGEGWQNIIHPQDQAGFTADFDQAFKDRAPFSRDVRVVDRHGVTRWLHSEARPREIEGRFVGYVGCDVDITEVHLASEVLERGIDERTQELAATNRQLSTQIEERERVEATLRQMQRLEAIGQLTSGVAHDFNNLLTVILGNVDLVARAAIEAKMDEKTRQRLGYMRTAAERGATLTAQLLAFSRRQRLEARPIDLNDTVIGMRDLLQSSMGGSVRLEARLRPDLWPALVDPTQIELIILNLAINARDAMEVGGSLVVSTDNIILGEPERAEEPPPGDYVLIAVTDSGSGMTPAVRDRAFEPFFTTKPVGKGSGLGLPQVYGFAKQSGGGVAIETTLGEGTSVRVYLPRAEERRRTPRPSLFEAPPEPSNDIRGRRILVVDDDPPVREITATMLRTMGVEVVEAGSGGAALEILGCGDFDLVVVDFAMPGMNGAELAAATAKKWPDLPILFVTGFADLSAISSVSEDRIVQKPFRGGELQRKIGRLLASRAD